MNTPDRTVPMRAVRLLLLVVSVLLCVRTVWAGQPHIFHSEQPLANQRREQLSLSAADSNQLLSGEENNLRLADLLLLKQSILDVLSQPSVDVFLQPSVTDNDPTRYGDDGQREKSGLAKRVFCNSFTGCGGRFRGRRRQQQPVAEIGKRLLPNFKKRPFCNSYGCFNSGKKRLNQAIMKNEAPQIFALADDGLEDRIKRLFCNGYGGCQNLGKRLSVLDTEANKALDGRQRTFFPISEALLRKLESMKRVFTYDFNAKMDEMIKNMRR